MSFTVPTYDALLNTILTDYVNQEFRDSDGNVIPADTSKGSLIYVKSAAIASTLWGLYQHQRWVADQIFPDTADVEYLEHHAYIRGISKKTGETNAELLARLLDYIRRPPAGGNKYDYVKWALEITNVSAAYCIPLGQGLGTVDLVLLSDTTATGSEIPTAALLASVREYIVDLCPTHVKSLRVLAPEIVNQAVTMAVTGSSANLTAIAADITSYMQALIPGQPLYRAQLANIAIQNGADDATVTVPAANVTATSYQIIRPGAINVA
jgi:uncharacterized phage protein gp47/JayE